ncbi:MAG: NAD-binding protein [Myxococcales bacterium]|jgi:Trk K+ transport system NAD-binding subunit
MRAPLRLLRLRYLAALLGQFRVTMALAAVLFGAVPVVFVSLYRTPTGDRIGFGEAFHHVYFLSFGQPSLPYMPSLLIEALNVLVPPFGVAVVFDGFVRFAYLFFAKHKSDKEWIAVMSKTLRDHIIVCGAGRVGYRVAMQLLALGRSVIVVEKKADATFVSTLRDADVPVLIDDIKSPHCLPRTNVREATAIVCATDDDLANMNVALDARKLHPRIRVVMRLFDDDLVAKVRDAFKAEALSTSALAAPALALAALDPRILHSFQLGGHLLVVASFAVGAKLEAMTLAELRDRFGSLTLSIQRSDAVRLHPPGETEARLGDGLTLQSTYGDYLKLRAFTGETV